jgi:hypothetical protein
MDKPLPLPSNRSFGWTFSGIFLAVGPADDSYRNMF